MLIAMVHLQTATSFMCRVASATENTERGPSISVPGSIASGHVFFE